MGWCAAGSLMPIFHCNVKMLALAALIGQYPKRETLALPIPTCWYLKALSDPTRNPPDPTRPPTLALGLALVIYISCCLCQFHSRWVPLQFLVEYGLKARKPEIAFALAAQHEQKINKHKIYMPNPKLPNTNYIPPGRIGPRVGSTRLSRYQHV